MVKVQDETNNKSTNINVSIPNQGNASQNLIPIKESLLKGNITPFIPKSYLPKKNIETNTFLESKINLDNIKIQEKNRKNSTGSENDSTSDENSPEKKMKKKKANKNKKKGEKVPFKGEAKDFKIKYKTELCKFFEIDGKCKYGDKCAYAHGKENLRSKVTNTTAYRTKKCTQFFETGYCPYGSRCQFAHQLKSNIINNPYEKGMSYSKILGIISKLENVENIKKLVEKPRLPIFEEICKENKKENEKETQSRLFNDVKKLCKEGLYERIECGK